eukprot:5000812-Alexandrium_andersonii.AAC.1
MCIRDSTKEAPGSTRNPPGSTGRRPLNKHRCCQHHSTARRHGHWPTPVRHSGTHESSSPNTRITMAMTKNTAIYDCLHRVPDLPPQ